LARGHLGDPRGVEPLITGLGDKEWRVQNTAAMALDKLDWQPDDKAGPIYWMHMWQWDKCVKIGAPAVEPLIAALKQKDNNVQQAAAGALGQIGDPRAVEPLITALRNEAIQAAAKALVAIGAPSVEPLIAALEQMEGHARRVAEKVLRDLGGHAGGGADGSCAPP
ncbi:MAG: HEAT repeat domain-containing protein, partial [Anaerolineales bacterium]